MPVVHSMRAATAVFTAVAVLVIANPAAARESTSMADVSLGLASGVCTLAYTPVKIAWAVTGTAVAGLVYLFSVGNGDVTGTVFRLSAGGDYVVTPDHLKGTRVLRLIGV
ncbi:MAG: hypothetical protein VX246_13825 [Myxococcota bacterium]|nr:hypothetical protein [Myxococcota bacterium]